MNAFALLGFDPRPWLDPAVIYGWPAVDTQSDRAALELSKEIREAKRILTSPRLRLRHLFELTCGGDEINVGVTPLPPALAASFDAATRLEGRMSTFLARKGVSSSPLGRAMLAREGVLLREEAEEWLVQLAEHELEWLTALREWDARWEENDSAARSCEMLAMFAQAFVYLERWRETVRSRALALMEP